MGKSTALTKASPDALARESALATMNEALRAEFELIAEETRDQAHKNVMFYYKLGERAKKIHGDTQKYGEGAVEKLSSALTIDRGLIYKAMSMAGLFDKDELKALMERRTESWGGSRGGNYLTWTHLSQLVPIEDKKQVNALIEQVFEKDLSVRDLRDVIRKHLYSGAASNRQATPRTVMGGLSQMLTMTTKLNQKFIAEFGETVFDQLQEIEDEQITDEMLQRVNNSEESLLELADQATKRAGEMKKIRDKLVKGAAKAAKLREKAEAAKQEAAEAAAVAKEAKEKEAKAKADAKAKDEAAKAPVAKGKPDKTPAATNGKSKPARKRERRPVEA